MADDPSATVAVTERRPVRRRLTYLSASGLSASTTLKHRRCSLRIGIDVTPLLGSATGIGRYVASLLDALARGGGVEVGSTDSLRGIAFTVRSRRGLAERTPPGCRIVGPPVPARALHQLWARSEFPPVTWLTGSVDIFHGTNFVLPPTGRAAGVVTVHDLSFLRTPATVTAASQRYRRLVPRSLARAAVVCTPSQAVADDVCETYDLPADRVVVTPLGVASAWGASAPPDQARRRRLGLPRDYYVFSGSLEPRKNLPVLLRAQRRLVAADPRSPTLVLVGPPGWGPQLDLSGLPAEAVLLTGHLNDDDLRSTVAGARLLAYPSAYEGFGLPPLEALACGVPVVASDLPAVREVLGPDPELATLVPPGDVTALTEALAQRFAAPDPPGAADRRRARAAGFTWQRTAAATRHAYALAGRLTAP